MSDATIQARDDGPLLVKGPVVVVDGEGNQIETKEQFALCRCGGSKSKPFCDGTHKTIGFDSKVRATKNP